MFEALANTKFFSLSEIKIHRYGRVEIKSEQSLLSKVNKHMNECIYVCLNIGFNLKGLKKNQTLSIIAR